MPSAGGLTGNALRPSMPKTSNPISAGPGHDWDVSPAEARAIQEQLRNRVVTQDTFAPLHTVAGVDVGFEERGKITRAAVVVLEYPGLTVLEKRLHREPTRFPYVPGLLSFREIPAVLGALTALRTRPDLLLCDGQGYAHPRRFGLACHLGVLTDIPSIGAAKSRLIGRYADPGPDKGNWSALTDQGETIGAVLRTRSHISPMFISVGHRVCLDSAIRLVLDCCTRYRLPETTRQAHRLASDLS